MIYYADIMQLISAFAVKGLLLVTNCIKCGGKYKLYLLVSENKNKIKKIKEKEHKEKKPNENDQKPSIRFFRCKWLGFAKFIVYSFVDVIREVCSMFQMYLLYFFLKSWLFY